MDTPLLNPASGPEPELFTGRRSELEWLAEMLGRQSPQSCNLVGEPRLGKTSLLQYTYRQKPGLPAGMSGLYVLLRLSRAVFNSSTSFWEFFLEQLQREAYPGQVPISASEKAPFATLYALVEHEMEEIFKQYQRLVVLVDHADLMFESYQSLAASDIDDPDSSLRSLLTRFEGRLAFVFSSSLALGELYRKTVSYSSALFSVVQVLQMGLLAEEEARELVRQASGGTLSTEEERFILEEAGCHPALIKIACSYYLADRRAERSFDPQELEEDVRSDIRYDPQVRWLCSALYERREPPAQQALQMIAAGQGRAALESDRQLVRRLERLGLVNRVEVNGERSVALFSATFADWVRRRGGPLYQSARMPAAALVPPGVQVSPGVPALEAAPAALSAPAAQALIYLPGQRRVQVGPRLVELTAVEDRLLSYLYARPGQVCKPTDLLKEVWGGVKTPSVVEKTVNRLRLKIEVDPKRPAYLISMYGKGYQLQTEPEK